MNPIKKVFYNLFFKRKRKSKGYKSRKRKNDSISVKVTTLKGNITENKNFIKTNDTYEISINNEPSLENNSSMKTKTKGGKYADGKGVMIYFPDIKCGCFDQDEVFVWLDEGGQIVYTNGENFPIDNDDYDPFTYGMYECEEEDIIERICDMFDIDIDTYYNMINNSCDDVTQKDDSYSGAINCIEKFQSLAKHYSHIALDMEDIMILYNEI